jgi:hypothetical protein
MPVAKKPRSTASRTPWHPAFVQAFQLELEQYGDILEFIPEFPLAREPLRIDLIIIKKLKDVPIEKNIAAMFRGTNIIEYKGPDDYVSVEDFYKVYGYACLYAAMNKVPITDLTISFAGSREPEALVKHLEGVRKYKVRRESGGIYRVEGDIRRYRSSTGGGFRRGRICG